MDLKDLITDPDRERNGVWVKIDAETELLLARKPNPNFNRVLAELAKPYRQEIRNEDLEEDLAVQLQIEAMAETVLLGWKNLKMKGKAVKYTKEKAIEFLKIRDFMERVNDHAENISYYRVREDTKDLKN